MDCHDLRFTPSGKCSRNLPGLQWFAHRSPKCNQSHGFPWLHFYPRELRDSIFRRGPDTVSESYPLQCRRRATNILHAIACHCAAMHGIFELDNYDIEMLMTIM